MLPDFNANFFLGVCSKACLPLVLGFVTCLRRDVCLTPTHLELYENLDAVSASVDGRHSLVDCWRKRVFRLPFNPHLLHLVSGKKTLLFYKHLFSYCRVEGAPVASGSDLEW